jgi:hypothetical protein
MPMPTLPARSADTDADAEAVQLELLRRAGTARRAAMALALSAQVIGMARRALRRAHPELSETEAALRFVELHYGRELAEGVRRRLAADRP